MAELHAGEQEGENHLLGTRKRAFLGKGLVERHPVAIGLCVDQYSVTVEEQCFRPVSSDD